ncbi:NdvB protein [Alteromonas sp. KUL49]|uniref:GH36-type glycosyl hydrolase domain-containing protein n=1 Tax=Alteromonas sp. KUL49 TaxID=2480798 RepID=UPI00102F21C5|nr:NdvB protein [Alteromonas sp. KUL49]TAP38707.1 NdvB protein [Alteromonas sp. KUL49]GEA12659.1 cellobionic acid phosphorylase [Alteromonas sp. KUL49]
MTPSSSIFDIVSDKHEVRLNSPTSLPDACGFLWNRHMMIQMNCRGYANAQHMQPEPAKYSKGPSLEATTFMQPEHHYHSEHPGRFFYVKIDDKPLFSLPYEPVRAPLNSFQFIHGKDRLAWEIHQYGVKFFIELSLGESVAEHWQLGIENTNSAPVSIEIVPMFSIGYLSWMNQSAYYDSDLNSIVATSVTPYQKTKDYEKVRHLKDITYFASDTPPYSWTCNYKSFIGEGHLANPEGLKSDRLNNKIANYEFPVGIFQYKTQLDANASDCFRWKFGAVNKVEDIEAQLNFDFTNQRVDITKDVPPTVAINTPDEAFDDMVNRWLPRQLAYHGQMHRLTTDPQTRNFLQDSMGLIYLAPDDAKKHFVIALSQQHTNGAMPDGILLHEEATLKYINQVPHSDHNVWLIWFIEVYLRETNDTDFLNYSVGFGNSEETATVYTHLSRAMSHLLENLDHRGLSLIKEGDWCDPMNMVGKDGKGVSAWLTMATSRALSSWSSICAQLGRDEDAELWSAKSRELNSAVEEHFWIGEWYARGITDKGRPFGTHADEEGKIYLNAQGWAMLSLTLSSDRVALLNKAVKENLTTPYGPMMLAPSYTKMHEDIGRLTQKSPGVSENGSVYNHAAAFYAAGLYRQQQNDLAFDVLKHMIPSSDDVAQRGQLPVYLPNYYRGAYYQYPHTAGRSSHLFNTGTIAWFYHCVIEGLLGLRGGSDGLYVSPQLPSEWTKISVTRVFRGHCYRIKYIRHDATKENCWEADGESATLSNPLPKTESVIKVFFS